MNDEYLEALEKLREYVDDKGWNAIQGRNEEDAVFWTDKQCALLKIKSKLMDGGLAMKRNYKAIGTIGGDPFVFGIKAPYIMNALSQAESMIRRIKENDNDVYGENDALAIIGIVLSSDATISYHTCQDEDFDYQMCGSGDFNLIVEENKQCQ